MNLPTLSKYEILAKIGEGGTGSVYRALHPATCDVVAIKIIPVTLLSDATTPKRLEQEFLTLSRLEHRGIVRVLDFGQEGTNCYLVMELIDGISLAQRLQSHGRLPESVAVDIIIATGRALHAAHEQGLIHRDVKPSNVMLTRKGFVKLTDFGTVKERGSDLVLTGVNELLGTPNFMAPEQFDGAQNASVRSDVYALAATLYAAVTGRVPFEANTLMSILNRKINQALPSPRVLCPTLSERTERAILAGLNPDPKLRTASCVEFLAELKDTLWTELWAPFPEALNNLPTPPQVVPNVDRRHQPRRRARGRARYQPSDSPFGPPAMAILVNASLSGVQLVVQECFQLGACIEVELLTPQGLAALKRDAVVRWTDGAPERLYQRLGCSWKQPLTHAELKTFI